MTFEEWWNQASDSWQNAHSASRDHYRLAWEAATAAERERCAKVCEALGGTDGDDFDYEQGAALRCADAIRAG